MTGRPPAGDGVWAVVAAVAARPDLWATALRRGARLAPRGWWRRWPPLPAPDRAYLRFRARTAYGDPDHVPEPTDVLNWLQWCREWDRLRYPQQP